MTPPGIVPQKAWATIKPLHSESAAWNYIEGIFIYIDHTYYSHKIACVTSASRALESCFFMIFFSMMIKFIDTLGMSSTQIYQYSNFYF